MPFDIGSRTARKCSRSGAASCGHPADKIIWQQQLLHSSFMARVGHHASWSWLPASHQLCSHHMKLNFLWVQLNCRLCIQCARAIPAGPTKTLWKDLLGSRRKRSCHPGPSRSHFFLASWLIAPRPKQPLKQWAKIASKKTCGAWPEQPILSSTALQEVAGLEAEKPTRKPNNFKPCKNILKMSKRELTHGKLLSQGLQPAILLSLAIAKQMFLL